MSDHQPDLKNTKRQRPEGLDRVPPYSLEAEQGVLGCVLLDPAPGLHECRARLKMGGDCFYDLKHQLIYKAMLEADGAGQVIDLITLQQRLKDQQQLELVGGITYLLSLSELVPSAANIRYYLDMVVEKHVLRTVIHLCRELVDSAYEKEGEVGKLVNQLEARALGVRQQLDTAKVSDVEIREYVEHAITKIENRYSSGGKPTGITTGFPDLDRLHDGLHPGEMVVLAAESSAGKTALAMNIVEHVALDLQLPIVVFSLEMPGGDLVVRMMGSRGRVNVRGAMDGRLMEQDFPKLTNVAARIQGSSLIIRDASDLSVYDLRAQCRRLVSERGVKVVVIDYLQLLNANGGERRRGGFDSRQEEVAEISRVIKSTAKELAVPIVGLSQINEEGKLRESRSLQMDADTVLKLKRVKPREEDGSDDGGDGYRVDLHIEKQRNGPTGKVELVFLPAFTRFESLSRVSAEDIPTDY